MKKLQRKRSKELEAIVDNKLLVEGLLQDPTGETYAGKGSRPMPECSFSELFERNQRQTRQIENVLIFAFLNERFAPESPIEIPAAAETMWCIGRPGDDVLLSDRATHHYTTIGSIDHICGEIRFLDAWPNDCFLLENRNEAGVAARRSGNAVIITKAEFSRVVAGIQTIDSPDFVDVFLDLEPPNIRTPALHLALGSSLLFNGNDAFVRQALVPLRHALELAEEHDDHEGASSAAQKLHLALSVLSYSARAPAGADREMKRLGSRYPERERVDLSTAEDCFRLGLAAGKASRFAESVAGFSLAIEKNPEYEDAYTYRALSRQRLSELSPALDDIRRATKANERNSDDVERRLKLSENQSAFRRVELVDELARVIEKRATIFQLQGQIRRDGGDLDGSVSDSQECVRLQQQVASLRATK